MQDKLSFDQQMGFTDRYIRNDFNKTDRQRLERIKDLQKKQSILFMDEFLAIEPGKELETTRIGYPPYKNNNYPSLPLAPNNAPNRHLSRYRLIHGPVDFYLGNKPTEIPLISTCAPNLAGSSQADLNKFSNGGESNRNIIKEVYETECNKLADFIIGAAKAKGHEVVVMPTYGLGVYIDKLNTTSKNIAKEIMYKAFAAAAQKYGITIDWIIWKGVTPEQQNQAAATQRILKDYKLDNINPIVNEDMLDYAKQKIEQGHDVVMLNPGSDRTIGGQYNMPNKKTLEEQIAQKSDLLFLHSAFNKSMAEQFEKNILNRRQELSHVSPLNQSMFNENALEFRVLEKVVKDLNLDKSTTITKKEFFTIDFKNLEEATLFSEFLYKNGITDDYDGDQVPILFKYDDNYNILNSYISLMPEQMQELISKVTVVIEKELVESVKSDSPSAFVSSQKVEPLETISQTPFKSLENAINANIKSIKSASIEIIPKGGRNTTDNYKFSFKERNEAESFLGFMKGEGIKKGSTDASKAIQQPGNFIVLTPYQFGLLSTALNEKAQVNVQEKVSSKPETKSNEKPMVSPQNVINKPEFKFSNQIDMKALPDQIKYFAKGIEFITALGSNYGFYFQKGAARDFSDFLAANGIKGQKGLPKAVQPDGPGREFVVLTSFQCFMISKISEVTQAIANQGEKPQKQRMLIAVIENKTQPLSVMEMNMLYNVVKNMEGLNTHRNPRADSFFGIENTDSWKNTVGQIRTTALEALFTEVNAKGSDQEKLALLEQAKTYPLFCEHRNNSVFSGAWGRTTAVKRIEEMEEQIQSALSFKK